MDSGIKRNKIPDKDHISRYCKPSSTDNGEIQATAFLIREKDDSLSVNWLEFLKCKSRKKEIEEIRKIYSKKLHVSVNAKLAVLNIGKMKKYVATESLDRRNLQIRHTPSTNDPSHSGIFNVKPDQELIAELILETVQETYPARKS